MRSIAEFRTEWRAAAADRGVNPRDVDVLLSDLLQRSQGWLFAHGDHQFDPTELEPLLARRFAGEPLQYIRGRAEFYGREFLVDARVLIPRPETEHLVEAALRLAPGGAAVIDVGTGSGCIPITLERERPDLRVTSVDISFAAIALARVNARRLDANVHFVCSDVLSAIRGTFDLIVSNPPYVPHEQYVELQPEVRDHEPQNAVTSGPLGTEVIQRLFAQAPERLRPRGKIVMEMGQGQEERVRGLAAPAQLIVDKVIPDLAGIPRVVVLSKHADQ